MIRGVVNARHEAVVRLRVRGPGGVESDVESLSAAANPQPRWPWSTADDFGACIAEASW